MVSRPSNFRRGCCVAAGLWAALWVGSASAVTSTVFFNDSGTFGGFGLSSGTALAAIDAGIRRIPVPFVEQDASGLPVQHPTDIGGSVVFPTGFPTSHGEGLTTASSPWTVAHDASITGLNDGSGVPNNLFLLFGTPLTSSTSIGGNPVTYPTEDVGLVLQSGMGGLDWVIFEIQLDAGAGTIYYPGVSLGVLGNGGIAQFPLNYVLKDVQDGQEFTGNPNGFFELAIPQWQLLAAFVPIPEPSTALLLAAGLGILAAKRRRTT